MSPAQDSFVDALLDPARAVPAGLVGPDGLGAGRRFDVYRNNVAVSLTEALEAAFPVLAKLLGAENFRGLSGLFLRRHPPASPLMMFYGAPMPDFLAAMPQLAHLPYLADVARLELALREAYHAADAAPVQAQAFQALDVGALMDARLVLHPGVRVVTSRFPVHAIWAYNMVEGATKPRPGPQTVLVTRPEFDPVQTLLPDGGAALVAALGEGQTLGAAIDTAQSAAPGFDLAAGLAALIGAGAITAIESPA